MGRIIVGVSKDKEDEFVDFMFDSQVPFFTLGHVTKGESALMMNHLDI
jgi:phosphoribosylformylglycinamidine synthase